MGVERGTTPSGTGFRTTKRWDLVRNGSGCCSGWRKPPEDSMQKWAKGHEKAINSSQPNSDFDELRDQAKPSALLDRCSSVVFLFEGRTEHSVCLLQQKTTCWSTFVDTASKGLKGFSRRWILNTPDPCDRIINLGLPTVWQKRMSFSALRFETSILFVNERKSLCLSTTKVTPHHIPDSKAEGIQRPSSQETCAKLEYHSKPQSLSTLSQAGGTAPDSKPCRENPMVHSWRLILLILTAYFHENMRSVEVWSRSCGTPTQLVLFPIWPVFQRNIYRYSIHRSVYMSVCTYIYIYIEVGSCFNSLGQKVHLRSVGYENCTCTKRESSSLRQCCDGLGCVCTATLHCFTWTALMPL